MWTTIYNGYIGFAMTLFTVVGALSVCVIACIVLAMLANTLQDLLIAFKDNWDEYRFFIYHQANFELWLDSNGYNSILMATRWSGTKNMTGLGG